MHWNKWFRAWELAVGILGLSSLATASCPNGYSIVYIQSVDSTGPVATSVYHDTCVATVDPDGNGKCAEGKVNVSGYQCAKPPDGTVVVGSGTCPAGEILQGVNKCVAAPTPAMTCPNGTAGIMTSSGNSCADNANMVKTPPCQPTKSVMPLLDPDASGNCMAGDRLFHMMTCAAPGAGITADPSVAKTQCICPSGQTYQTIEKCSLMPLACPAGQGSVIVHTISNSSSAVLTSVADQKCVSVTKSDASGKCPDGQVLVTATTTATSSGTNVATAILSIEKMCVTGSAPNADGSCPTNAQIGDGQCIAILNDNLPTSTASTTATPKAATSPTAPQSEFGGGGSCSLIRQP